jgi:hypothetical protein
MFGIEKVAVAKRVDNGFSGLTGAIVDVAKKTILPNERFFVKVQALGESKRSYAGRDVEFAASGTITAELAAIGARPAKSEEEANRVLLAFIGRSAHVCILVHKEPGGLPLGYLGGASCAIYGNFMSFSSCLLAARSGFQPRLTMLYEDDLQENARAVQALVNAIGVKEHRLKVAPIRIPDGVKGGARFLARDMIAMRIVAVHASNILLPLLPSVHPQWFIESAISELVKAGKVPYTPLMFLLGEPGLYDTRSDLKHKAAGMQEAAGVGNAEFHKYDSMIDTAAKSAIRNMKEIKLKVGPNYLHDILDSI